MAKRPQIGTYLWEDLGKPQRLRKKGRVRQLPASLNAYLYAVTFWTGHDHKVVEIGKGWVALQHPKVEWKVVVGVSPRFVPRRYGPLYTLSTIYGNCYANWKPRSQPRRRLNKPERVKVAKNTNT